MGKEVIVNNETINAWLSRFKFNQKTVTEKDLRRAGKYALIGSVLTYLWLDFVWIMLILFVPQYGKIPASEQLPKTFWLLIFVSGVLPFKQIKEWGMVAIKSRVIITRIFAIISLIFVYGFIILILLNFIKSPRWF